MSDFTIYNSLFSSLQHELYGTFYEIITRVYIVTQNLDNIVTKAC